MTGPDSGWYFDPDNDERERYWNGHAWTDHRRSATSAGTMMPSIDAPQTPAEALTGRNPYSAANSVVPAPPTSDSSSPLAPLPAYEHDSSPGGQEHSTDRNETPGDATNTQLCVGGSARIVDGSNRFVDRIGTIKSLDSSAATLKFSGSFGTFDFPRRHVVAVAEPSSAQANKRRPTRSTTPLTRADSASSTSTADSAMPTSPTYSSPTDVSVPKTTTASPSDFQAFASVPREAASGELTIGGMAKVVSGEKYYQGRVGKIVSLDTANVELKFKATFGTSTFQREHLTAVADTIRAGSSRSSESRCAGALGDPLQGQVSKMNRPGSGTTLRDYWAGLATGGRVAFVAVPALAVVGAVVAIATTSSRDEASYTYGHDELGPVAASLARAGTGGDANYLCGQAYVIGAGLGSATKFVKNDVLAGCADSIGQS